MAIKQNAQPVIKQFEEQVEMYSQHEEMVDSPVVPFLRRMLPKIRTTPIKIGEFGGGGGDLLASIRKLTSKKLELANVELVKAYKKTQALKEISFTEGSILNSKISNDTFDIVMVRNVLHHLIGTTLYQTRINQRHAISELVRVTKPGGLILIDEQVNNSRIACSLYYYLSKIASKIGLRIEKYQITPNTIVGYLTREELREFAQEVVPKKKWLSDTFDRWPPEWHWHLTGLMESTGTAFIAMQKPKDK